MTQKWSLGVCLCYYSIYNSVQVAARKHQELQIILCKFSCHISWKQLHDYSFGSAISSLAFQIAFDGTIKFICRSKTLKGKL